MNIQLNHSSTTPLYQQIRNKIRDQILSGQLVDGFKIPSERQMVERLGVHRNTVKKAYEMLIEDGLIYASVKSPRGYFVRSVIAEAKADGGQKKNKSFSSLNKNFNYHFLGMQNTFQRFYNSSYLSDGIPFAGVLSNKEILPQTYLQEILKEISEEKLVEPYWFCDPQGTERFRGALTDMLFERNIYIRPQNIQVITETYEALSNIAFMYLKEGDYVIVEEPTIPAVVNILLHTGANVLFVPVEKDGMKIDILENLVKLYRPKLIYTMPDFQNPSTCVMSVEKRKRLLKCAYEYNIPIVEDDSLNVWDYNELYLPRLFSLDTSDSVIYIDSFNLSFFPGARIGYMVAPDNVIQTYSKIINKDQLFLNSMSQYLWARFYEKGYYTKYQRFLIDFYRKKRDLMREELSKIPGILFEVPQGGLVYWIKLPEYLNDRQIASAAERKGLFLMPGHTFFVEGGRGDSYLRLSFSSVSDEQIVKGCSILRNIIEAYSI
ncbi:PLP-dependent aminotransferase family protein [Fusobacterium ulcerans]|uniref:aminotransferase-like domain-containing protein n=1 Tax=Fusobacterium ulcerans TaxID=861 RepID=UPI0034B33A28